MYIVDLTHFLNAKGAIGPESGPGRKMADFLTAVVAHVTDVGRPDDAPGPLCAKCRKRDQRAVEAGMVDDHIVWRCAACGFEGRISGWQGTFWDLRQGTRSC